MLLVVSISTYFHFLNKNTTKRTCGSYLDIKLILKAAAINDLIYLKRFLLNCVIHLVSGLFASCFFSFILYVLIILLSCQFPISVIYMSIYSCIKSVKQRRRTRKLLSECGDKDLEESNRSIISSNCIGGILYHDYQLRFLSPTIGLTFKQEEFSIFCLHLNQYLSLAVEKSPEKSEFPVGVLNGSSINLPTITLYFVHHKSFEEAAKNGKNVRQELIFLK
jgi:hypothetical protein